MGRVGQRFRNFFKKAVKASKNVGKIPSFDPVKHIPKGPIKNVASQVAKKAKTMKAKRDFFKTVTNPNFIPKVMQSGIRGQGFIYPGSKYIGPGNPMDKGAPATKADANAYQHDLDYDNYIKKDGHAPWKVYLGFSDADQRLIDNTPLDDDQAVAVNYGMNFKKALNKTGLTPTIKDKPSSSSSTATKELNGDNQPPVAAPGNPSNNGVLVRVKRPDPLNF